MVDRVDAFAHVMPPAFHEEMLATHPTDALRNLYFEPLYDTDRRLADMDAHGIDRQVLTLANPPIWRGLDPETALPLTRLANDEVRAVADAHPDRFVPVATLPFAGEDYRAEFERCVEDLGMAGVQVFSNVGGRSIDSPAHLRLYEAAERAGVPVWLHPQLHGWYDWLDEFELHRTFGWPFDTTVAMARLVFGGVFERCPDLSVVTHHMGGMVPFFAGRLETFYEARVNNPDLYPDFEAPELSEPVGEAFRRFHGDTVVGGSDPAMACGRAFFGDDWLLFGTDYPFGPEGGRRFLRQAVGVVEALEDPAARAAVFAGNLRELL